MRAFGLIEIIIVVVIVAIISSFAVLKLSSTNTFAIKAKIKADVAMVRNALQNTKQKFILQGSDITILVLDEATINSKNQKLFVGYGGIELVEYPVISSSLADKKLVVGLRLMKINIELLFSLMKV